LDLCILINNLIGSHIYVLQIFVNYICDMINNFLDFCI